MHRHYHVIAGAHGGPPFAEAEFDSYEDSIQKFTVLSTGMFGHLFEGDDKITLERIKDETHDGEGNPLVIGTPRLCIYWFACDKCEPLTVN